MNIRILFLLLLISALLSLSNRHRKIAALLACASLVLLLWTLFQQSRPLPVKSMAATKSSISSSAQSSIYLPAVSLRLQGNGAPWKLRGEVRNDAEKTLQVIRLRITRLSCPTADSVNSVCTPLWSGTHDLRINLPANTTRQVDESFYSHDAVIRATGIVRDNIEVEYSN